MPNMVTAFKHSLLSFYADLKKTTSLRHYIKKLCGKKPRLSYGAFGREFLFGLIKIAKQNSVFACMVISQLKLSEMQIQWPLLLQEIWVAESWFSIVFCLVVFFPPQGRTSKKKIWQLSRVWENESHVSYIPTQSTRHDEDWTLLCCTSFLHQNVLSRRQPWCYPSVTSVELHLRRCLADNLTLISNNIRGHSLLHCARSAL